VLKKISCYALLLAWLLPLLLIAVFHIRKTQMTERMEHRLEVEALQQVILPAAQVRWVKPGKEIMVEGRMFDIKSFRTENDRCYIVGLFDDEETGLLEQMNSSGAGTGLLIIQFLALFQPACPPASPALPIPVDMRAFPLQQPSALAEITAQVPTPPPRRA